jgi:hypothetical protein
MSDRRHIRRQWEADRLDARNVRRQRLARHLHECGVRPMFEAMLDIADGRDLDEVLQDFGRVSVETYHSVDADDFPTIKLKVVVK